MFQTLVRRSHRAGLGLLAGLLAVMLTIQPAAAQAPTRQLDQSQTVQTLPAAFNSAFSLFQTFTAGLTGGLDQVDLPLARLGAVGAGTVTISIVTVGAGGVPSGTVLASTTVPAASLPVFTGAVPNPFTSFSLSPAAPVVAGTQYAIHVAATVSPGAIVWGAAGNVYPGGQIFIQPPTPPAPIPAADLAFRTFVTPSAVSVGNAQVTEGNTGTTNLTFPVTLSAPVGAAVTAPYTLANGTATGGPSCTAGVDFVNTGGTVTIAAGATTGTITVPVCGDTLVEPNEAFTVTLGTPTNATLGAATATGTILNDDAAVSITKTGPASVTAGSNVAYTIAVTNGGAVAAADVSVADPTPAGLTFVSTGGACTTAFPCSLGTVGAGETRVITATFAVPSGYGGPSPFQNVATVTVGGANPASATASTTVAQAAAVPAAVNDPNNNGRGDKKDRDETSKETEDERRSREHTNQGGADQYATSGQVVSVGRSPDGGYLLVSIKTIDPEPLVVAFACPGGTCPDLVVGDVIEVDGVQGGDLPEQKGWFMAESFDYVTKAPRGR